MATWKRARWWKRTCWACGLEFQASRCDANLCGSKCRQHWSRLTRKVKGKLRLPLPMQVC